MEQNAKISGTQVFILMFIFITSTITIYVPGFTAKDAKESAWLAASIIPLIFGYLSLLVVYKLGINFRNLTIFQYCKVILGDFLGKGFGIIYIMFLMVIKILVIREYSDFLIISTLPLTPRLWLISSLVILSAYAAYKGLEVIVRAAQFTFLIYLLGFIVAIALSLNSFQPGRLLPFMDEGLMSVIRGSIVPSSWYGEISLLAVLFPFVNKAKEVKRKGMLALLAITVFVTIDVAVTVGVFGADLTASFQLPFWSVVKSIEIGEVVQRVESLLLVFWISGIIIKAALLCYLICLGLTQVFGFKNIKAVLAGIVLSEVVIANFILGNAVQISVILNNYWPPFGMTFELFLPLSLLTIAWLRKKHTGGVKR